MLFEGLSEILAAENGKVPYGDEGGYAPAGLGTLNRPFEILDSLAESDPDIFLAIDAAATEFYRDGSYRILGEQYSADDLLGMYKELTKRYALRSIEDPFEEGDVEHFARATEDLGASVHIVGDDLTVTNPRVIAEMAEARAANAVIIKPNQIGTLTETFEAARRARENGWHIIVSHRSGETEDSFIADLAYGLGAYGIKAGAPTQPQRRAKYERLMRIEREEV